MLDYDKTYEMAKTITNLRQELDKLKELGNGINCVEKNIERISACLKMLELNINDTIDEDVLRFV